MFTNAVRSIAKKELHDKLKSRWVVVIALGFAVLTIVISYFGSAVVGITGFHRLDATIASLTSLVIYFIPILALTLGGGIIADEREKGTLDLFMSAPISTGEFIAGKFLGLALSLSIATFSGFGIAGIILFVNAGIDMIETYLIFVINSILLGLIFLSVSFLISILFYERARVIAFTIFLWLFFTILYDLGLVGLIIITKGAMGTGVFSIFLMLNPVDIYRLMNYLSIGELKIFIGLATVEFPAYLSAPFLWVIALLWVFAPLISSYYFFKKKYMA